MTELSPNVRPDFFGKDRFTPFLGVVEDVDDPKHASRVKVRCIGWHPKDKKELKTEDLPWAKVGSPTTHAQQNRIGGKHGLLVGSFVFGFFLDGDEANAPVVLSSLPFTAKAVDKDNRKKGDGKATASESAGAFVPVTAGPEVDNDNRKVVGETGQGTSHKGDAAGALPSVEDSDSDCDGKQSNQSVASTRRKGELKGEAKDAQKYEVVKGDGLCGPMKHAREDIQRNMKEMVPSELSRFIYNDAVWDVFSGNYTDVNGVLQKLAQLICNLLKQPANVAKAEVNAADRVLEGIALAAAMDRDGPTRVEAEQQQKKKADQKNAIFQETLIDVLCQIIMQLLQSMNSGGGGDSSDDNFGGDAGSSGSTQIGNSEAICLTDNLLGNINIIIDGTLGAAEDLSQAYIDDENNSDSSGDNNAIASILGALTGGMLFILDQKYSSQTEVHNTAGSRSQDIKTKIQGCNPERLYNTAMGFLGGGGGGGGSDFNGSYSNAEDFPGIGIGGLPSPLPTETNNTPCEDAQTPVIPDPGYDPVTKEPYPVAPDVQTKPAGENAAVLPLPLPSDNEICAKNFINGVPNTIVVIRGGKKYYYNNRLNPGGGFPTIYIPGYVGRPVPVLDRVSGQLVSILTSCSSWPSKPQPPVTIIPDDSEIGILTDDPNYDIVIGGFHIANTGFDYCDPVIELWDLDKETNQNGEVRPVVVEGRIVGVDIINNGTGFRRVPEVRVYDDGKRCGTDGGFGARLYPIMNIIPKPSAKSSKIPIEVVYCPNPRHKNLY